MIGHKHLVYSKIARIAETYAARHNITREESIRRFLMTGTCMALLDPESGTYLEMFEYVYRMFLEDIGEERDIICL